MVGIYVFIAICLLVPCAIAGYFIYISVQNKKSKRKLETRKATADLFYRSKNLQYMAKVFKKSDRIITITLLCMVKTRFKKVPPE